MTGRTVRQTDTCRYASVTARETVSSRKSAASPRSRRRAAGHGSVRAIEDGTQRRKRPLRTPERHRAQAARSRQQVPGSHLRARPRAQSLSLDHARTRAPARAASPPTPRSSSSPSAGTVAQHAHPRDPAPPVQAANPPRRLPGTRRRRDGHGATSRSCSSAVPTACATQRRHRSTRSCTASSMRVDPSNIPNHIDVDVTTLAMGQSLHVSDLTLPAGLKVLEDDGRDGLRRRAAAHEVEATPVSRKAPRAPRRAVAEPELIRKTKPEDAEDEEAALRAHSRAVAHPDAAAASRRRRPMKVIVGLGNPGREYERTRHNVGWWVVDHLADVWHFDGWQKRRGSRAPRAGGSARMQRAAREAADVHEPERRGARAVRCGARSGAPPRPARARGRRGDPGRDVALSRRGIDAAATTGSRASRSRSARASTRGLRVGIRDRRAGRLRMPLEDFVLGAIRGATRRRDADALAEAHRGGGAVDARGRHGGRCTCTDARAAVKQQTISRKNSHIGVAC